MFEIQETFSFEAGHVLKHHDGRCKDPHGHSYVLIVHVSGKELINSGPKTNMIIDFYDIINVVKPMIDKYFDHKWLNDTLISDSVTVEYMAKWIFDYLEKKIKGLSAITVCETPTSRVTYRKAAID